MVEEGQQHPREYLWIFDQALGIVQFQPWLLGSVWPLDMGGMYEQKLPHSSWHMANSTLKTLSWGFPWRMDDPGDVEDSEPRNDDVQAEEVKD